jgi:hypothetical protein
LKAFLSAVEADLEQSGMATAGLESLKKLLNSTERVFEDAEKLEVAQSLKWNNALKIIDQVMSNVV